LGGLYPGELYTPSARVYRPPTHPEYPFHDRIVLVTHCGRICIGKRKISLSRVFAGQYVGVTEIADDIWLVSFMDYDLGFFDNEGNRVEPVGENPFAPIVFPMCPEWTSGKVVGARGFEFSAHAFAQFRECLPVSCKERV
jgi:hypothetical protein